MKIFPEFTSIWVTHLMCGNCLLR